MYWLSAAVLMVGVGMALAWVNKNDRLFATGFLLAMMGTLGVAGCLSSRGDSSCLLAAFKSANDDVEYLRKRPIVEQVGIGTAIVESNAIRAKEIDDLNNLFLNSVTDHGWADTKPIR